MTNHNDMEHIDKKINEVAKDNLNALSDSVAHLGEEQLFREIHDMLESSEEEQLLHEIHDMLESCDKKELKKILRMLINMHRASFEEY